MEIANTNHIRHFYYSLRFSAHTITPKDGSIKTSKQAPPQDLKTKEYKSITRYYKSQAV
ncbi:hypothetical protein V0R52_07345 [Pseudomonas asiatica]|uniref:hypothetical protein n=1 Tax=Pseudomonas TaxID=286 RepID=UPI0013053B38|nr:MULTISPECIES: hypothetical protein [Pseudomonas]MEE1916209.1 hypothetical protein [Pseudomonas asiatica]WOB56884.1 hypothetical protein NY023_16755 [Pseudomonas sp. NBB]